MKGDHSNFVRDDELDASWKIFSPLLHYLDEKKDIVPMEYPYGKYEVLHSQGFVLTKIIRLSWPSCPR